MWSRIAVLAGILFGLSACGYVDAYEEQVYDWEPVYCYKSLAATSCYDQPNHRDEARLVNYFGPHPSRYDKPELEKAILKPPEMVNYFVKDPEPIPRPAPQAGADGGFADRPWLTEEGRAESAARKDLVALQSSEVGTLALLRRIDEAGAAGQLDLPTPDLTVR